ncbi:pantoate--beta-alanine ligase [Terasakiispira papahanaumokuakeensis]|uniref:Pantothenate synthetase n=1 Tax=Terasakiispira papahanaumokuakeensis TaxID=197479 RepID=A0A1E2VCF2_9GAMM|nr:pantoate--beta-alanine ligase [Terasakiispira papahanaumokuakeensis]ODC04690.1 pantoate--beta-alanine ligase [Terasakiispira papahanaumokuakeensis]
MKTLHEHAALSAQLADYRQQGQRIALVPTMGHLHAGHISLISAARQHADIVVATIFVNPMQFGPNEDFDSYPRTLEADQQKLAEAGCDLLFAPTIDTLYPQGLSHHTVIHVPEVSAGLCGQDRPGHFDGVATVVTKLFNLVQPDVACFGQKDYQQVAVIRKMVADLCMSIDIITVPTVRAADGLALSSRNSYLSPQQRDLAPRLYATLQALGQKLPHHHLSALETEGYQALKAEGFKPDYVEIRALDLSPATAATKAWVILAAARLGETRLIDNLIIAEELTPLGGFQASR